MLKMDDLDSNSIVISTKSSVDSGCDDIGFLSDSSNSSRHSDGFRLTHSSKCLFEENNNGQLICFEQSCHHCALRLYSISGRGIETLSPRTFFYLANCVKELDLSKNNIQTLPETIGELQHLQKLNLSCNKLVSVPDSCKRLQHLLVFNLSQNQLREPPLCLELGMEHLVQLDLSQNQISNFPNPPKCLPLLQSLNLSHNYLNVLPLWLFSQQCRSIVDLDVSFNFAFDDTNSLSQIPLWKHHRTSALKSLKILKICNTGNKKKYISPLSSFESLQSVHLSNHKGLGETFNYFSDLEVSFFYNPNIIVELHLANIGLGGLPEDIYKFNNLEILDASQNRLDWLPDTFGLLKSLKELILSDCNLSHLPENFGQLKSLKKLLLDHNKITDVRGSLGGLSSLEWLDIYDNQLEELPVSVSHFESLHAVDLAYNYINLEVALNVKADEGESLYDVYCRQQARLREAVGAQKSRNDIVKVYSDIPSWESLDSLHRHYHSDSESDLSSLHGDSYQPQYSENHEEEVEDENWDDISDSEVCEFDPKSVERCELPPGQFQFGWTPRPKRRGCQVPYSQRLSGFFFVPGQLHQKTTVRSIRRKARETPPAIIEGQFDDVYVDGSPDLQQAESLCDLLRKMLMFVRNPAGLRSKRRCRFHSVYEDCLDPGLWFRISPPMSFEIPEEYCEEEDDI